MRSLGQEEEGRVKMFTMQNAGKEDDSEERNGMSISATRGSHVPGEYSVRVLHVPSLPCMGGHQQYYTFIKVNYRHAIYDNMQAGVCV